MTKRYKARALQLENPADQVRFLSARKALVNFIWNSEPRFKAAIKSWLPTAGATRCLVEMRVAQQARDRDGLVAAWRAEEPRLVGMAMMAVHPLSLEWLGPELAEGALLQVWELLFKERLVDVDVFRLSSPLRDRANKSTHRLPKNGLKTIGRNVGWFYRHEVQGESIGQIAREHVSATGRTNNKTNSIESAARQARKEVKDAIAQAEAWLQVDGSHAAVP